MNLNYFKKLVQLRKKEPILTYGSFEIIDKENPTVFAYLRTLNDRKILIALNFSDKDSIINTSLDVSNAKVMLSNYSAISFQKILQPYEAIILEIRN